MTRSKPIANALDGRQLLRAAVFALCVAAVFLLPFLVPPAHGISMSWRVGFNNHAALGTLLVVTLGFALWTRGWGLRLATMVPAAFARERRFPAVVVAAAALAGVLALLMWLRTPWGSPGVEAFYFLDRYAMFGLGYVPFRTMTFDYGPLLFYPVVWVHAATGLSLRNSYFLCWGMQWMVGTVLLWDTVRRLAAPWAHRVGVFAVVFAMELPGIYSGGANYTPLRYVLAPWFAMLVWQRRSLATGLVVAFAGFCVALLYSPEQGISFLVATLLFFAVCVRGRAVVLPLVVFTMAGGAVLVLARRAGLVQTMLDFGGGGYDLPLLMNARTVALVALLVLAGCAVVRRFFDGATDRPEIYLVLIALGLLPVALGRADAGHLFANTMPAVLVALLVLWQTPAVRGVGMVLAGLLVLQSAWMAIWPGFYGMFGPHLAAHVRQMLHPPPTGDDAALTAERAGLQAVLRNEGRTVLFAPLSYLQPVSNAAPLPIATGRFFGFGLVSERFVQAKLAEIEQRRDPALLVPAGYDGYCWTPDAVYIRAVLKGVLNPWVVPAVKHTGNAAMPMCLYLRAHYGVPQPSPVPGYVLLPRVDAFASSR